MCHNTSTKNLSGGFGPCNMFQVRPLMFFTCDPSKNQSGHDNGMNCGMGDGSVRFVTPSVTLANWVAACDPQDNAVPTGDW